MDIALLVGSLRKESYTRKVAFALRDLAPSSMKFENVPLGDLSLYNQDLDERPPREWVEFRERVRDADGVLFATPEYNRSVPGVLKNAIDIGSRPYGKSAWQYKPTGVISVTPGRLGAFGANHHLRQSLVFLDMPCMQQPEIYISHVAKAFDDDGNLVASTRELLEKFAVAFSEWVERFAHAKAQDSAA